MPISPTAEGFRAVFRRPSLALAEITWRWASGAAAAALFLFGLLEYLDTLPVGLGEKLFLRSRQPYLIGLAIAHILRGSLNRVVMAAMLGAVMLGWLWIVAASLGRIATVRALLDYFRYSFASRPAAGGSLNHERREVTVSAAEKETESRLSPLRALVRLNFLRAAVALAAILGFVGAAILAGFVSTDVHPRPGLAFLLFAVLTGVVGLAWWMLNWLLSLAGMFAVRDGGDAVDAVSGAVSFSRRRTGSVFAVSTWTGLAHVVAFVGATTVATMALGLVAVAPWRLLALVVILVTLAYFVVADWLYMARLAGYVCIAEMPEALPAPLPLPPAPVPTNPPGGRALATTIDRDELILSDVTSLLAET